MKSFALQKAIETVGGQVALANILSTRQSTIWNWLNTTGKVPAEHVIAIEKATNGAVSRHELRPDIYPLESIKGAT